MDHAKPFFLIKWQERLKECSINLSQNILIWNYILFTISYQNTLLKPENSTQGHITSRHKDIMYDTTTSIIPQRHRLCHEDISYATKTSIRNKDGVTRYQCHKDYDIWLSNHRIITCYGPRVKTRRAHSLHEIKTRFIFK